MKNLFRALAVLFFLSMSINSSAQNYVLDKKSNTISWIGYAEVGDFFQEGTIELTSSTLKMNENGVLSGEVIIDMKSLHHDDKSLKDHLKNEDFFDVKKYPIATFEFVLEESGKVSGKLEIKGIKGEVVFIPKITKKENQILVEGEVVIDRTYYGIKYNSSSYFQDIGSYAIKNNFNVNFQLVYNQEK